MKKRIRGLLTVICLSIALAGFYGGNLPAGAAARSTRLTAQEKELYGYIVDFIKSVATGEEASTVLMVPWEAMPGIDSNELTAKDLGVSALINGSSIAPEAKNAVDELIGIDINPIMDIVQADNFADLFWYDKTSGMSWGASGSISYSTDRVKLPEDGYIISFYVSADYSKNGATGTTQVDTKKTAAAQKAVKNAQKVVKAAAGMSDYEKLRYYAEQICAMTDYDYDSYKSSSAYGNPWQFVNVFDGNDSTKVVCEGYSKAFKLLCDLTEFDSPLVECRLVSGAMSGGTGAGSHMWNLVTMEDGLTYMADITNCDDGSVGQGMTLFLKGCEKGTSSGYSIYIPEREEGKYIYYDATVSYTYAESTSNLYLAEELTIAKSDYDPLTAKPAQQKEQTESGQQDTLVEYSDDSLKMTFESDGGSGLMLKSCKTKETSVTVPATVTGIDGSGKSKKYKVTGIASGAFKKCSKLKTIILGKNIESIEKRAFYGAKKLSVIEIKPAGLTSVRKDAFLVSGRKLTIQLNAGSKLYKKVKKLIERSGLAEGVTVTRVK